MAKAKLTIETDDDWLALVAYRYALRLIVEEADTEPWKDNPEADIARAVLERFPGKP